MYRDHFRLTKMPFSIAPDPLYLYMSEGHREALAHLLYGIRSEGGFVLLTGEVGTGKTTVCRCLLEQLPDNVGVAFILNPKLSTGELLANICDELRIRYPSDAGGTKVFIDAINAYLLDSFGKGRKTVLIIEEAQNLSSDVLEQVRLLTNLETNERKLLQVIMIGQPELREKLALPELKQLAQRITARYHLGPLSRQEISAYVTHRLQVAGGLGTLFAPGTMNILYRLSGGIPRLINIICDRALLGAYVKGTDRINAGILKNAAKEVLGTYKNYMPANGVKQLAAAVIAALLAGAIFAAFTVGNRNYKAASTGIVSSYTPPWQPPELAEPSMHAPGLKILKAESLYKDPALHKKKYQKKTFHKKPAPVAGKATGNGTVQIGPSDDEGDVAQHDGTTPQTGSGQEAQ